ncbi:MAG: PEGA domain-containing protein [Vicinamibacterales bacterium]
MKLRVVTLSLIAAIAIGSPALAGTADEQQQRGRGARDRGSKSGGGDRQASRGDNRADRPRVAVPRDAGRERSGSREGDRNSRPQVVVRQRPSVTVNLGSSYRGPRYYTPVQYDRWARYYARWSPVGYAPWSLIYGSIGLSHFGVAVGSPYYAYGGYGNYGYGYPSSYGPGAYSPWQASGNDIGGVRLKLRPRDAQVFVDGYYAGLVDDFDGSFQSLRLESGGHKIEIHMPGFEDLELDVHVQPGRTITLSEDLRPRR